MEMTGVNGDNGSSGNATSDLGPPDVGLGGDIASVPVLRPVNAHASSGLSGEAATMALAKLSDLSACLNRMAEAIGAAHNNNYDYQGDRRHSSSASALACAQPETGHGALHNELAAVREHLAQLDKISAQTAERLARAEVTRDRVIVLERLVAEATKNLDDAHETRERVGALERLVDAMMAYRRRDSPADRNEKRRRDAGDDDDSVKRVKDDTSGRAPQLTDESAEKPGVQSSAPSSPSAAASSSAREVVNRGSGRRKTTFDARRPRAHDANAVVPVYDSEQTRRMSLILAEQHEAMRLCPRGSSGVSYSDAFCGLLRRLWNDLRASNRNALSRRSLYRLTIAALERMAPVGTQLPTDTTCFRMIGSE